MAELEKPSEGPPIRTESEDKPWDASIRLFVGYNDNVPLVPDNSFFVGDEDDIYGGVILSGVYRAYQKDGLTIGVNGMFEAIGYAGIGQSPAGSDETDDYNMWVATPGVFVSYRHDKFKVPMTHTLAYDFRWEEGGQIAAIGRDSHTFRLINTFHVRSDLDINFRYEHGFDDFSVTFPNPQLDDRDANWYTLRGGVKYWWYRLLRNVEVYYEYLNNNAEGRNFRFDSHEIRGRLESHLWGPIWGALDVGYRYGNYDGFVSGFIPPPGRDYQHFFDIGGQLAMYLRRNVTLDIYYKFTAVYSNQPQFETDAHNVGVGITFSF